MKAARGLQRLLACTPTSSFSFTTLPRSAHAGSGVLLKASYASLTQNVNRIARTASIPALPITRRVFHVSTSLSLADHYGVLEVHPTATTEEIKKAYITKSKMYHPDRNASSKDSDGTHTKFLEVNEAFQVLSDTTSRHRYDSDRLRSATNFGTGGSYTGFSTSQTHTPPSYQYPEYEIYHGKSPYQMFSNSTIVVGLVVWVALGIIWHYVTIKKTKTELEVYLEQRSRQAAANYAEARERAKQNGYKKQLEILRMKVAEDNDYA